MLYFLGSTSSCMEWESWLLSDEAMRYFLALSVFSIHVKCYNNKSVFYTCVGVNNGSSLLYPLDPWLWLYEWRKIIIKCRKTAVWSSQFFGIMFERIESEWWGVFYCTRMKRISFLGIFSWIWFHGEQYLEGRWVLDCMKNEKLGSSKLRKLIHWKCCGQTLLKKENMESWDFHGNEWIKHPHGKQKQRGEGGF